MFYFITEEKFRELFQEYKASGLMNIDGDYDHFKQVTLEILPPGTPDPDHARHK